MNGGGPAAEEISNARLLIERLKELWPDQTDEEIYLMLRQCNMNPDETAQKYLLQGFGPVMAMNGGGPSMSSANPATEEISKTRLLIERLKELAPDRTDKEIYFMLRECNMNPDDTAQKYLLQDPFHEVMRNNDKKNEGGNKLRPDEKDRKEILTDGFHLATSGGDTVKILDTDGLDFSLACSYSPERGSRVNAIKWWNHTDLVIASASDNNKIALWCKNGECLCVLSDIGSNLSLCREESVKSIGFSNQSWRYLCSGGSDKIVRIWDLQLQNMQCINLLRGHHGVITGVMYNCNDEHVASISLSGDLLLHKPTSDKPVAKLKDPHNQALRVLDYSRINQHILATGGDDGSLHLWDTTVKSRKASWFKQHSATTSGLCFSPLNDNIIATAGRDNRLYVFDFHSKLPTSCTLHGEPFSSLAYREDGLILAAGTDLGKVVLFYVRARPQAMMVLDVYNSETVTSMCWQRSNTIRIDDAAPIIPHDPIAPPGPIAPLAPPGPIGPPGQVGPVASFGLIDPWTVISPPGPVGPLAPFGPIDPLASISPPGPVGPLAPFGPIDPRTVMGSPAPIDPLASTALPRPLFEIDFLTRLSESPVRIAPTTSSEDHGIIPITPPLPQVLIAAHAPVPNPEQDILDGLIESLATIFDHSSDALLRRLDQMRHQEELYAEDSAVIIMLAWRYPPRGCDIPHAHWIHSFAHIAMQNPGMCPLPRDYPTSQAISVEDQQRFFVVEIDGDLALRRLDVVWRQMEGGKLTKAKFTHLPVNAAYEYGNLKKWGRRIAMVLLALQARGNRVVQAQSLITLAAQGRQNIGQIRELTNHAHNIPQDYLWGRRQRIVTYHEYNRRTKKEEYVFFQLEDF